MPPKTAWRPKKEQKRTKKNKKEQKNRDRNNKKMWLSFSNIIVDNITMWTDTVGKGVTEKKIP